MMRVMLFLCVLTAVNAQGNIFDIGKQFSDMIGGGISNISKGVGNAIGSVAQTGMNVVKQVPFFGPMAGAVVDTMTNIPQGVGTAIQAVANGGIDFMKQIPVVGPMVGAATDTFKNIGTILNGPQAIIGSIVEFVTNALSKLVAPITGFIQSLFPNQHTTLVNGGTLGIIGGAIMLIASKFI